MSDVYAPYREKYAKLCAKRDELNARVAPLRKQMEEKAKRSAELNDEAVALSKEIQRVRGGQSWLDLKKEIGALAKMLGGK